MTPEQQFSAVLGPLGALALALLVIVVLGRVIQSLWRDHLESVRQRLADKDQRILELSDLLDKAMEGNETIGRAMEERNRLEKTIVARGGGSALAAGLTAAEDAISSSLSRRPPARRQSRQSGS